MRLSAHFTLQELVASVTALREGIDNTPRAPDILHHLYRLAQALEQVRALCGNQPLYVHSGYRCEALNTKVGGAPFSAHLSGRAADFDPPPGLTHDDVQRRIAASAIDFDECYEERAGDGAHWLHLSIPRTGHVGRRKVKDLALDRLGGTVTRVSPA